MKTGGAGPTTDPFEIWRDAFDANERAWSEALEQAMGSPEFGESSGKLLETMLAAQKSVRSSMRTYLESVNVPTREDIAGLGEIVIGVEEKVDQIADRLDAIEEAVGPRMRTDLAAVIAPIREEIARLAGLVVGLEKKIERRQAVEDAARARADARAKTATARAKAAAGAKATAARAKATADKARSAAAKAPTVKRASTTGTR
jgi:hypothetical protein